ncbi:MAG: hypothetical protein WCI17_04855 [bacterium]
MLRAYQTLPESATAATRPEIYPAPVDHTRTDLAERGETLADADLLIAATTLTCGGTLVSGNRTPFARIPGLTELDWTR